MPIPIRGSRPDDGPALREIERLAGERFREAGLDSVATDEPLSIETLAHFAIAGRGWVAVDEVDQPVGYVVVDVVDGHAHIEQITVLPECQGAGIGRALVDRVRIWATEAGGSAITLTTFAEVPWNRPLFEHLGFVVILGEEVGPERRAVRGTETLQGLDPETRVCMRLDLHV